MQGEVLWTIHWCGNVLSLWAGGRLMGLWPTGRILWVAAAGAAGALIPAGWPGLIGWPLLMTHLAWPRAGKGRFFRLAGAVWLAGNLLCGLCTALWQQGWPPLWAMAAGSLLLGVAGMIFQAPRPNPCRRVEIVFGDRRLQLSAMVDTGNLLRDPLTALPVIVCSRQALKPLLSHLPQMRHMSVRTCAGAGWMLLFEPIEIRLQLEGRWQSCRALIGLAPDPYDGLQALVPAALTE